MNHTARPVCRVLLLALGLLLSVPVLPVNAGEPRADLLRFVPADSTLCVLLQGLRERGNDLARSPFLAKLLQSPLGKNAVGLNEVKDLLQFEKRIEQFTGLTTNQLREEILGDLIVLAYRNGPVGKPEQDEGLILVHARDPRSLARLVEHVNNGQKASGEVLTLEERKHRERVYTCRKEKEGASFYHLRERILLFSTSESMLRRALEQDADLQATTPAPVEQSLQRLGLAEACITFWVQPRAFDAILNTRLGTLRGDEACVLRTFLAWWKALDALGLALDLNQELTLNLSITARPEELPTAGRTFLSRLAEPSRLWRQLPEDPLFALTTRVDLTALLELGLEFLSEGQRRTALADLERTLGAPLGKELVREILPAIGPDAALLVLPPSSEKVLFPALLLAVRVRSTGEAGSIDQTLWDAVHSFATILVFGHNQKEPGKPLTLKRSLLDRFEIRSLVGDLALPAGFQPSYALARGHLILGTATEGVRSLIPLLNEEGAADTTTGPVPVLRVSLRAWREYLTVRQTDLAQHLVKTDGLKPEEARARVMALLGVLEYVDRLEVRHQPAAGRLLLQVAIKPRWPLK